MGYFTSEEPPFCAGFGLIIIRCIVVSLAFRARANLLQYQTPTLAPTIHFLCSSFVFQIGGLIIHHINFTALSFIMTGSVDPIQKPFTVAIVGGGIGGIALAIGLLHRGIAVQVYEAAPAFAEIGAGIGFGPNSVRSMYLISPAIKAAFDGLVTKNEGKDEEETWINFRCGMGEPELIAKVRTTDSDKTGISSVHRAYFLNRLVKFVPEDVANFGKRLLNLHPGPASTVRLEFEDGTMAEADAVVGCDGVRSRVRRILRAQESDVEDMKFSRKVAYRGLIPMDKARAALGDNLAGNAQMYIGPGGSILTYPIDHGKTLNVAAFRTKEDGRWEHSRWMLPKTREDVKESYRGWGVPVQKITEVSRYLRKRPRGVFNAQGVLNVR